MVLQIQQADSMAEWIKLALEKRRVLRGSSFVEDEERARAIVESLFARDFDPAATQRQQLAAMTAAQKLDRFERISVPTLVLHGDSDPLVSIEHGQDTASRIPQAVFQKVGGMGHAIPDELGQLIAERLDQFYRG